MTTPTEANMKAARDLLMEMCQITSDQMSDDTPGMGVLAFMAGNPAAKNVIASALDAKDEEIAQGWARLNKCYDNALPGGVELLKEIARLRAAIAKVPPWEVRSGYTVCRFCGRDSLKGHATDCVWNEINGKKESVDANGH